MTIDEKQDIAVLLAQARLLLTPHHDIVDGDGKQRPNWAMRATTLIDEATNIVLEQRAT